MLFGSPGGSPPAAASPPPLGDHLVLFVARLLDVPIARNALGGTKAYRIRVLDEDEEEIAQTKEIRGLQSRDAKDLDVQTIALPPRRSVLKLHTYSPLVYIQVEHSGGILGDASIGRCQIHRLDPRSAQVWPYALNDDKGNPANCGIELKVVESDSASASPTASQGVSPVALEVRWPGDINQMEVPASQGSMPGRPPLTGGGGYERSHGVSALLVFDKVADLPQPRNPALNQVLLSVVASDSGQELRRLGPFPSTLQHGNGKEGTLMQAMCGNATVLCQAPLIVGGGAKEGSMYLRVHVSYANIASPQTAAVELVGVTDVIKVGWPRTAFEYAVLRATSGQLLGGVYVKYHLQADEVAGGRPDLDFVVAGSLGQASLLRPAQGAGPVEQLHLVSGRTGHFPAGSPEEVYEQAALNAEAQNRALLQRCKIADPHSHDKEPHTTTINGYRQWESMDKLFSTMGPNPLAMCPELGPLVARSYRDDSSILRDLVSRSKLPPPSGPADEHLHLELIKSLCRRDPLETTGALRPTICKDPEDVLREGNLSWCPDPPVYAPMSSMHEEDKETLRLACFAPEVNAKLLFSDTNPNYRVEEDIWGACADYKLEEPVRAALGRNPGRRRRVKDDCMIA